MSYTELQTTSNFSFLCGASHPEELVEQAAAYGYSDIAITDRNSFAGIVRAHTAAKAKGIRLIPACRLDLLDGPSLLAYPTDKAAYSLLSGLLTIGNLRAEKGACHLYKADVYAHPKGIKFMVVPPDTLNEQFDFEDDFKQTLQAYSEALGANLYLAACRSYTGQDQKKLFRLSQLATAMNIPLAAANNVLYHHPLRRELQDILTCVREKCTIYDAGYRLQPNAERYLKPADEMERLFRLYPDALARTQEIAAACTFSLDEIQYIYPEELTTDGRTPQQELTELVWQGAKRQFGGVIPEQIRETIHFELAFIERKGYAPYFLTVYDYVRFAREQHILCQGRGSAANSVVCFCLGITSVNPSKFKLLFARFMSDARDEPPDIDVDFEHERREEVIQYIYSKFGRDRAAIVATVTQERTKGAIRDVAKAMGLSVDTTNRLSACVPAFSDEKFTDQQLTDQGFNPHDKHLRKVLELTGQLLGFPRQLGQHTGGFVITQGKLQDLCPVLHARMDGRTQLEWNKDDLEALGILKVDVLALGMLTMIRKAFDLAQAHYGLNLTLANIPQDDPKVYDMISRADTVGLFQIESRAQMSMLPRLKPRCFYDLVIEVAIVRPGPIQGDMVHPYLRRRNGQEPVEYPSKELEAILGRTLGVPLFQEQAMEIAIIAAGFTPAEADQLRRSMATFKANGKLHLYEKKLVDGMVARGYEEGFSRRVFKQLQGFEGYGFPESHAASFALLVYVSAWLKCYYPDVFATALLNSQPMGFYQPAQIVIDAQKHGVTVLPVDVNYSGWDNTLAKKEGNYCAIRLGFRQVKGMREADTVSIIQKRGEGFTSLTALLDAGLSLTALERLNDADALGSLGLDRRSGLWEIAALADRPTGLFEGQPSASKQEQFVQLPLLAPLEEVIQDYATTSLSLKAHPVSFVREKLTLLRVTQTGDLGQLKNGRPVRVCGLPTIKQRPGTAKGVVFMTIEDETGFANLVIWQDIYQTYRKEIQQASLFMAEGTLQIEQGVINVVVTRCFNATGLLGNRIKPQSENKVEAAGTTTGSAFHKVRSFK